MNELNKLVELFESNRNEENAEPMKKYMKNLFPFLGIKAPLRRQLMRDFYKETGILQQEINLELVKQLWMKEEREYQYAALDYLVRSLKKINSSHLLFIENLIITKSWWDTVDVLAPHLIGKIAKDTPSIIEERIEIWAFSDNIWLKRSSVLFQLKYKLETNETYLYKYIRANADSKEFFIQKAIGWALREYSKTNPDSVREFINEKTLAKLSVREGSKYI
ncbi:DNA alkylation repair protein [Fredinandcohnia sp. QZ13]|uniref:DNA alkylation repair protein n=1 Tax=Fredinandcohnia sp. QZ13 TaxID=3073144 RepID=UPI0028530338|nr:DNA alkylation repair protein [Fredinandcohnia sp. QZ13]MDR4886217.1 DNA alkylation repair protein [Fredinandcohnia sp. QZ13]